MDDISRPVPPPARLRWRWTRAVTGLVLCGLALIGYGVYFLAGDNLWYTVVWVVVAALAVARPIRRAGRRD